MVIRPPAAVVPWRLTPGRWGPGTVIFWPATIRLASRMPLSCISRWVEMPARAAISESVSPG